MMKINWVFRAQLGASLSLLHERHVLFRRAGPSFGRTKKKKKKEEKEECQLHSAATRRKYKTTGRELKKKKKTLSKTEEA